MAWHDISNIQCTMLILYIIFLNIIFPEVIHVLHYSLGILTCDIFSEYKVLGMYYG